MHAAIPVLAIIGIPLYIVESWLFVRLGRAFRDPRPQLGWVPLVRSVVVAHAADTGWVSWIFSYIPVVGSFVAWQWWDDIFFEVDKRYTGWRALGTRVPLLRTYVIYTAVVAAETRFGVPNAQPTIVTA